MVPYKLPTNFCLNLAHTIHVRTADSADVFQMYICVFLFKYMVIQGNRLGQKPFVFFTLVRVPLLHGGNHPLRDINYIPPRNMIWLNFFEHNWQNSKVKKNKGTNSRSLRLKKKTIEVLEL